MPLPPKHCAYCGTTYTPTNKDSQYCSRKCYLTVGQYWLRDARRRSVEPPTISKCRICHKQIRSTKSHPRRYCSLRCYNKQRKGKFIRCTECGKQFYLYRSWIGKRARCSKKCANAFVARTYGSACATRLIEARKHIDYGSPRLRAIRSEVVRRAYASGRLKPRRGKDSPFWKGGISTLQNRMRQTAKYKKWRKAVYERDGYKCRWCGSGKNLHAHHIKEFSTHPRLRYVVSNGLTLCKDCHSKHHGRPIPNIGSVNKKVE